MDPLEERSYRKLNQSAVEQITRVLESDPAVDIQPVLNRLAATYPQYRLNVPARVAKNREREKHANDPPPPPSPPPLVRPIGAVKRLMKSLGLPLSLPQSPFLAEGPLPSAMLLALPPDLPRATVVHALSPAVLALLGAVDSDGGRAECLSTVLLSRVLSGKQLWENGTRAVIQVSESIVVKFSPSLDHDEHLILRFVEQRLPSVPAPRAHGLAKIGSMSYIFMTLVPGTTLEARWPALGPEEKTKIRDELDAILQALRRLELPDGECLGSPVGRRLCKDVRRDIHTSPSPIHTEAEFNDFLVFRPSSRAALQYQRWVRSMMREGRRIVYTHADLYPRNIMVDDGPDGACVSGIIDWEMSGFYPEYWEYVKAICTRPIRDTDDWWDHLPPCICGYDANVVMDRFIETSVV